MYRLGQPIRLLSFAALLALAAGCGGPSTHDEPAADAADDRRVPVHRGDPIRVVSPSPLPTSGFGAALALSGDRLAVGEFLGQDQARVRVFRLVQDEARPLALLHPPTSSPCYGRALGAWESTVAVGDPCAEGGAGVVRVYQLQASGPVEVATLRPDPSDGAAFFGAALALRRGLLVVGAPFAAARAGGAFTYADVGGAWLAEGRLVPGDLQVGDAFGWALAINGDTLAVTAPGRFNADPSGCNGLVHVFEREDGAWEEELDDLVPAHTDLAEGTARDVAVAPGVVVVTGDSYVTHSVHAFELGVAGWAEEEVDAELRGTATDTGFAHALSMDGDLLAVGMPTMVGPNGEYRAGGAWLYRHEAAGWRRVAAVPGVTPWDKAGHAVDVDRGVVAVGVPGEYVAGVNAGSGSVVLMRP